MCNKHKVVDISVPHIPFHPKVKQFSGKFDTNGKNYNLKQMSHLGTTPFKSVSTVRHQIQIIHISRFFYHNMILLADDVTIYSQNNIRISFYFKYKKNDKKVLSLA